MASPFIDYEALHNAHQAKRKLEVNSSVDPSISVTGTTLTGIPDLGLDLEANRNYMFRFCVAYSVNAQNAGARFTINGPAFDQLSFSVKSTTSNGQTQAKNFEGLSAYGLPSTPTPNSAATSGNMAVIEGIIRTAESGPLIVAFAAETNSSSVTVMSGSWGHAETVHQNDDTSVSSAARFVSGMKFADVVDAPVMDEPVVMVAPVLDEPVVMVAPVLDEPVVMVAPVLDEPVVMVAPVEKKSNKRSR